MVTEETESQEVKGFLWITEPGCGGEALELSQVLTLTCVLVIHDLRSPQLF